MTYHDAMKALEAAGTAQNRKVYARHGVRIPMFGVSYAALGKLRKAAGTDQALAARLWASGNHDARVLATMVADPESVGSAALDVWAKDLDSTILADALSQLVARTPHAAAKLRKWTSSSAELTGQVGWNLVSHLARAHALPETECGRLLETVEKRIHGAKNRVRHAMNGAVISIGLMGGPLFARASATAKRIGKVEVDHGDTGCKTPDAVAYLTKNAARAKAAARKPAKRKAAQRSR